MKHNKLLIFLSISAAVSVSIHADCDNDSSRLEATSKTTLAIHPLFVSQSPEMVSGFRNDRNQMREDGWGGAFQAVFFGSRTTNGDDLARYFFPDAQESLIAAEDGPAADAPGFAVKKNLLAQDFNVFTVNGNFESTITIEPQQSVIGFGMHYRQSFWKNHDSGRGFWLSVSAPIQHVKNDMNFFEKVINDGGGANEAANDVVVANMTEAFTQTAWEFGKISACSMKKTGLGDIEFKVGYEWLQHEPAHMESYLGLVIPTGNRNEGEFVFEPIVGRGKYFGVMFGSCLGLEIWNNEAGDKNIRYELANHTELLFRKEQVRSFDLKNRPWSRYLPVYATQEEATQADALKGTNPLFAMNNSTPGINVFTQEVKVTPGLTHDINTAFIFSCGKFQGEVGYNFLAKRAEKVELDCPWQPVAALKHFNGNGTTNPIRTINGSPFYEQVVSSLQVGAAPTVTLIPVPVDNFETVVIQATDIDLNSAATPAILTNTLYGTLGFHLQEREYPLFGNFGASYTFSKNNDAAPRRWILWVKSGVSF
ncbi:MAG TPA: hypothetical protein VLB80_00200 [Candidatus Babeliales bacterium]|nr:hypothetical protein [Candidatus Babeliales bacterium]